MRLARIILFIASLLSLYSFHRIKTSWISLGNQNYSSKALEVKTNVDSGLNATLQRQENGRAAVVIIKIVGRGKENNPSYLFQRKSRDYPIPEFRNAVCLFGGNAELGDLKPFDTLSRELIEELPSNFVKHILSHPTFRYFGTFRNKHSPDLLQRDDPYTFLCACYTVTISIDNLPSVTDWKSSRIGAEGSHELITEQQLKEKEKFAWGYDFVFSSFLHTQVNNMMIGSHVTKVSDKYLDNWNV